MTSRRQVVGMRYTGTRGTFALSIIPSRHYNDNDRNNDRAEIGREARDAGLPRGVRTRTHARSAVPADSSENC